MYYAVTLGIGVVVGFVLARYFDNRLDKVQAKLQEIAGSIKK